MSTDVNALHQFIGDARTSNWFTVLAVVVLIYDHLISIQEEVDLIWKKKWNITGILFLWNRYFSIVGVTICASFQLRIINSNRMCIRYLHFEDIFCSILVLTTDLVLVYRIWILYDQNKKLLSALLFMVISEFLVINFVVLISVSHLQDFVHLGSALTGCYFADNLPAYFKYYVISMLMVSCIMFLLTLHRCLWSLREGRWKGMPIMILFFRDGLFWFLAVFACTTIQVVILTRARPTLSYLMVLPTASIFSIASSRVLLNIKGFITRTDMDTTDWSQSTTNFMGLSRLRFDLGPDHTHVSESSEFEEF